MKKLLLLLILLPTLSLAADPPPVDTVFKLSATMTGPNDLLINFDIDKDHFMYKDRFNIQLVPANQAVLGEYYYPDGIPKTHEKLGKYEIYRDKLELPLEIYDPEVNDLSLIIGYQGCADSGYCYPPTFKNILIDLSTGNTKVLAAKKTIPLPTFAGLSQTSTQDKASSLLKDQNIFFILISFLGFGLLLAFTPCVLPMVPILSTMIINHGAKITTWKAFFLSLTYVLSMSFTYAIAGLVVGMLGSNLQAAFQQPWVLISISTVFVLLALSFFGLYDLKLPAHFEEKISNLSRKQAGGHYISVAIMGMLATLIVSPCVSPALVGALTYIGAAGNPVLGGAALFSLGLGMGIPLILIGTTWGKILPKAGTWEETIKPIFGVMMIAVSIWLLERILPGQITMLLWAALLIISAMFMGALRPVSENPWRNLWKGLGLMMVVYGVLLIVGASIGNTNPLKPLGNLLSKPAAAKINFISVKSVDDVKRFVNQATLQNKPVMLDFYADWCITCKQMERTTFANPDVINALQNFVILKADVTKNDDVDKALLNHFNVIAPPSILFFDNKGSELKPLRIIGEINADEFLKHISPLN